MNVEKFLLKKQIWVGTTVADDNAPENYYNLKDLLEEYHQVKLNMFVSAERACLDYLIAFASEASNINSDFISDRDNYIEIPDAILAGAMKNVKNLLLQKRDALKK